MTRLRLSYQVQFASVRSWPFCSQQMQSNALRLRPLRANELRHGRVEQKIPMASSGYVMIRSHDIGKLARRIG